MKNVFFVLILSGSLSITASVNVYAQMNPLVVLDEINLVLATKPKVQKERTVIRVEEKCPEPRCVTTRADGPGEWCRPCNVIDTSYVQRFEESLKATSIDAIKVKNIKWSEVELNSLPTRNHVQSFRSSNCSNLPQTSSANLALNITEAKGVTISRGLNFGTSKTVTLNYNKNLSAPGSGVSDTIGLSTAVNFNQTVSISENESITSSQSSTRSEAVNKVVSPKTELWGELRVSEYKASLPFQVVVEVDGQVETNLNQLKKLSDVLSEEERTFAAIGFVHLDLFTETRLKFFERALQEHDCIRSSGGFTNEIISGAGGTIGRPAIETSVATPADPTVSPAMLAPSFWAGGQHQCQSGTDIGHVCSVSTINAADCEEAKFSMNADDCCPRTMVCGPNQSGAEIKCRLGGNSISFVAQYCLPM